VVLAVAEVETEGLLAVVADVGARLEAVVEVAVLEEQAQSLFIGQRGIKNE
jgi:hypothetical protein